MENIILGLLLLQSRTIYQLRKRINEGLNLMYSCSTGSIQATLKKLLKCGYICVSEIAEGGKNKKLYSITEEGTKYFNSWINSPIDGKVSKNPELAKIYFMGFSQTGVRANLIENYLNELRKIHSELEKICAEGERMSTEFPENEILFYQLQTANYGRDLMKFNIEWYRNLLNNIRSE